jgi:hypothetical protein
VNRGLSVESQFEVGFGFTDVTGKDEPVRRMTRNLQQCPSVDFITQVKVIYHSGGGTVLPHRPPKSGFQARG